MNRVGCEDGWKNKPSALSYQYSAEENSPQRGVKGAKENLNYSFASFANMG